MGTIYQSIEILSKEKGIDPQIVIDAVKDAMLVAARKHFRTTEDLVAEFNEATGALEIYGVKKVVETVQDPVKEISLEDAQQIDPAAAVRIRDSLSQAHRSAGPHFRADRQAGDSAKGSRSRARDHFFGILGPRGRAGELHGEAHRRPGSGGGSGQDRSAAAQERTEQARKLQRGRPHPLRHQERGKGRQERGRDRFARARRSW